ncbi:uncharacterized protein LOC124653149 [Lolium rigidum]|uniref:uncharacterized protein LOC124653149 n=1 Tax=Lolium rigidum TaxID=89674 RepID=UPI001F5C1394|nr:uncharacterized protein LOC124653149 [Lolium rigidum]
MFHFHAARPPRPTSAAVRAFPQPCGRTAALPRPRPLPPPPPPPRAAGGTAVRARGEAEPPRGPTQAQEQAAAGGNALAGDGAGRGSGVGEPDRKRELLFAPYPPPKRRAVSAKRQFPPGCGRDAPSLVDDGARLGAPLAAPDFSATVPEQASVSRPEGTGDGEEGCLRLEPAPAGANAGFGVPGKVTAADGVGAPVSSSDGVQGVAGLVVKDREIPTAGNGGLRLEAPPPNAGLGGAPGKAMAAHAAAPVPNGCHHGPEPAAVTSSGEAQGVAGFVAKDMGRTAGSAELGMKELMPVVVRPPPKRRTVSAVRRFPPGCGRNVGLVPLASTGTSEVALQLEALPADAGLSAVAANGGRSDACAVDTVEAVSKNALGGSVEVQEQEDGEIPTEDYAEIPAETDHALLQESHVTLNKDLHELTAGRRESAAPPVAAVKPSIRHSSSEKLHENMLQRSAKTVSWAVAEDANVMNKCEASSPKVATKPSAQAPPKEYQLKAGRHECAVPPVVAAKPSMGKFSDEKIHGNMPQSKGKAVSWAVAEDVKVMNKSQASSPKVASKASAEGPPNECLQDKEVSGSCSMKGASSLVAAGVQGQGIMRSKVTFTARKTVPLPVEANHKPSLVNLDRPYSTGKETESVTTVKESFAPRKKLKVIGPAQNKYFPVNVAPTSALPSKVKLKDKEASALDGDDGIWKAIGGNEGKLKMYLSGPSCVPSIRRHVQHGGQSADARSKVKMLCRKFQFICRTLVQDAEQHSVKSSRIDLAADKIIRTLPGYTKHGAIMGEVPGVEIGDEFLYRVELALVGLHRPYQGGIDTMKDHNDTLIAISIVASGGYPDELSSSGEVIYTGSGGKPAGKKENEDQKLVRGNLALKNCIKTKTPVRVIHGFKGPNREEGSHSKAKEVSTFTYDGLYNVVDSWLEGPPGSRVFKYRLQRIPGQPELPLHVAKGLRKSIVRPGICIADISQGKEKTPICVINNIDNARPTPFKYITRNRGPSLTANRSQGCDCTDGCSDSANCTCIVKNGGEIPFNFNGAVVHAKPLIFECGPSCKCPPSCHNRVSQLGMKIPLEVFRTAKTGWGVRSLRSIPAGSFICEYVGELLHGQEANQISNDEYLFDIGQNYDIWKDMPSAIPGLNPSGARSLTMEDDEGFTIDAAEYGNIGRFINHSCSPNLYAQNVLWDHDDKRVPHIMFFADENISPLQELTYDYNYEIGHVHDVNGVVKVKYCHCGSAQCRGRLY